MAWIQEIADIIGKLSFYEIVYEYQQGLYFRNGTAIEKRIKWDDEDLEEIIAEEKKVINDNRGRFRIMYDYLSRRNKVKFPEGYKRNILGLPRHAKRYDKDKVLRAGFYWNIPIIDVIVVDSQQEKILNLGNISVLTIDDEPKRVTVSCNIRYELMDFYRAFTAVHDYEDSLIDHSLSILAKYSRGKTYKEWADTQVVEKLEDDVRKELRKLVTEDWGLKIHEVYVTDNVDSTFQRVAHEGSLIPSHGVAIKMVK